MWLIPIMFYRNCVLEVLPCKENVFFFGGGSVSRLLRIFHSKFIRKSLINVKWTPPPPKKKKNILQGVLLIHNFGKVLNIFLFLLHFKNCFPQITGKLWLKKNFYLSSKPQIVFFMLPINFLGMSKRSIYLTSPKNNFREQNAKFRSEPSFWQHTFDETKLELKKWLKKRPQIGKNKNLCPKRNMHCRIKTVK